MSSATAIEPVYVPSWMYTYGRPVAVARPTAYDTLAHELPVVYATSLALLTAVAEAVEAALGLPALAEPSGAG